MLVDDNRSSRHALDKMLRSAGVEPVLAADRESALGAIHERPFRLVFVDAEMPDADAGELVRELKGAGGDRVHAILLSPAGSGLKPSPGFDGCITKPVRRADLCAAILKAFQPDELPGTRSLERLSAVVDEDRRAGLRILLVEDNIVNQKLAKRLLEKHGHQVVVRRNGREALESLDQAHFDLVLMDVQMPEMDGFEATAAIRGREKSTGEHIPIVAMTAHASSGDQEKCLRAGMDDYLSKPIQTEKLLATIEGMRNGPVRGASFQQPHLN